MSQYIHRKYINADILTTGTAARALGPVDVSGFDRFCLLYQNSGTAALSNLIVRAAVDPDATNSPTNWVQIPTATLVQPSALGANSSVLTEPINNSYRFIEINAQSTATTTADTLSITIAGFRRR